MFAELPGKSRRAVALEFQPVWEDLTGSTVLTWVAQADVPDVAGYTAESLRTDAHRSRGDLRSSADAAVLASGRRAGRQRPLAVVALETDQAGALQLAVSHVVTASAVQARITRAAVLGVLATEPSEALATDAHVFTFS